MPRFPTTSPFAQQLSDRVFGQPAQAKDTRSTASGPTYPLHVGDTYLEPVEAAKVEYLRSVDHPGLHRYAPVQGEPALLGAIGDKIERRSGLRPPSQCLQVMAGATAGLSVVATALLSPGDEVLLPAPFWPLIRGIIGARGATAVEVPLFDRLQEPGFDPAAALDAAATERTVAVYINTPNNPTGACLSESQLEAIGAMARERNLWIISDEVYEDLFFGGTPPRGAFTFPGLAGRTVATHSVSKAYALAGARVGYTHGPAEAMGAIRGVQTFMTYCAPRPMQFSAERALATGDVWLANTRNLYAAAAQRAAEALRLPTPGAGTFLFFPAAPYLRPTETTSELLQRCSDAGVTLTPGSASGQAYADWLRLCFTCVPPADLENALTRLQRVLLAG